ncbi:spore coat protein [Pseudoneobacillus sp. C159]
MQNQQGQIHQNMHTGNVPPQMNHGGHEMFDVHEVLSAAVGTMNQYTLLRQHVKDPELSAIMDRQYQFIQDEYNITLECFQTGKDPSHPTSSYNMTQGNDFVYGLTPTQPKKPWTSPMEISDEFISSSMLNACKASASHKTMAALETTNPVVRRVLADSVPNCIEMAYELSIYQNKHHYYQVPQLAQEDMTQILNSFGPAQGTPPMTMNQNPQMQMPNNNNIRH